MDAAHRHEAAVAVDIAVFAVFIRLDGESTEAPHASKLTEE